MEGLPPRRWPQAGNGLGEDMWSGFDLAGLEGDGEPPMNSEEDEAVEDQELHMST